MRIANMVRAGALSGLLMCAFETHAANAPHCSTGLQLILSAPQASQGSVILAEIRSHKALSGVTGTWGDRSVYFWKANNVASKTPSRVSMERRQALVGVDLEKLPGAYKLSIDATTTEHAEPMQCTATLRVRAGKFATESLRVEKQFVEPNDQQAQRAAAEQQKLRQLFDQVTREKLWSGAFQLPLTGAATGMNFGKRRILNGQSRSPHTGADFPAPTGTIVHATQSGQVVLAEELYFSGNTVIVDHGLGVYSLYGHLSAMDVTAGDSVQAGAVLGKVGATGRVTGPHLHWGVTVNRARVNPVQLVSALRTPKQG